jgi:hypothetical protein
MLIKGKIKKSFKRVPDTLFLEIVRDGLRVYSDCSKKGDRSKGARKE